MENSVEITPTDGGIFILVHVVPRASKTGIAGVYDGALKIRLTAPPVDGAANMELISFLAKFFGVRKAEIKIASGECSKRKRLRISGLNVKVAFQELAELL